MRVLAVDTSSERGSICIAENGLVLGEIRLASSVQQAERLFRSIEFLLDYVPFALPDVDVFVASRGPGSFTGLRIGLAAMEGFAAAHRKPSYGISTLAALAWKTGVRDQLIAPTIDARRGEVYGALYRRVGDSLIEERPGVVLAPQEWFGSLPGGPNSVIHFCGDAVERYRALLDRPGWILHKMGLYLAGTIAGLAETPNRGPLEPLYVRRTDAEIAREQRHHHESVAGPNSKS
jgi:tRNA threonylcarbamoyladenosine biosynthesis protein TsaB